MNSRALIDSSIKMAACGKEFAQSIVDGKKIITMHIDVGDTDASQITDRHFLSSISTLVDICRHSEDVKVVFTHVLSIIDDAELNDRGVWKLPGNIKQLRINVLDLPSTNLLERFDQCIRFLSQPGVFLIHCKAGMSRSATIICGFLMQTHGLTVRQALNHIIQQRPIVNPNEGFRGQLAQFERFLTEPMAVAVKSFKILQKKQQRKERRIRFGETVRRNILRNFNPWPLLRRMMARRTGCMSLV
jgi:predicted protein tyrosine phosphatase